MAKYHRTACIPLAFAIALTLSGCGGGGGSSFKPAPTPPPPAPPPPPPQNPMDDAEYQASNSATTANALPAYTAGATGKNVKAAVIDTGINPNLPEFTGRIDPASQDVAANRGLSDDNGHGSMVSGVIAANRDGIYMQGVAFEATILSLNVGDPAGCKPGNDCFLDSALPTAIDLARTNGAKIINMSFGDEEGMTDEIWGAIQRAVDAGIIIVMAAGNGGTAAPNSFAVKNILDNGSSGLFIIAGAMDSNRNIASFSDRAGTGAPAEWYLTALGVGNKTVNEFGQHVSVNGTSFATPTIVGAAALLAGAFPNLSGSQIVSLLLTTADDAGAAGTDAIFGRGILNIGRAFQPQGTTTLAGSSAPISLSQNGGLSGAMGDASSNTAGAIILDGYSRAFVLNLARTLRRSAQDQPLRQGIGTETYRTAGSAIGPISVALTIRGNSAGQPQFGLEPMRLAEDDRRKARAVAGMAIGRLTPSASVAFGFSHSGRALQQQLAGYREKAFLAARDPMSRTGFHPQVGTSVGFRQDLGPLAVTVTQESGKVRHADLDRRLDRDEYRIESVTLDRKLGPATFTLAASRLSERATVLGGRFSSILASGGSSSAFLDGTASFDLGRGWEALAAYRHGWTRIPHGGELAGSGRLSSNAFALDLSTSGLFAAGDKIAFRIMQPLRVTGGGLNMNLPVRYDYSTRSAAFENRLLSLAPAGRELDYEVAYGTGAWGGYLDFNAFLRTDPGHVESARTDIGAAIRFNLRH